MKLTLRILTVLLAPAFLSASAQTAPGFTLCSPRCGDAEHYVGYQQGNAAQMNNEVNTAPPSGLQILKNVAEVMRFKAAPRRTEARIELENGNFTLSTNRIDALRVGFARKSESILSQVTTGEGGAESHIRLIWGDTLRVTSASLAEGTKVTLNIARAIGGFGAPATDNAYYDARSQTLVGGVVSAPLDYGLKRLPGAGQQDQISGSGESSLALDVRIGDVILLEGLLDVTDGVKSLPSSQQFLNGADSSSYRMTAPEGVCLVSSSGQFDSEAQGC